ncbi:damage-control phosphatase ARMT1 family protein [Sulfurospirillum sp. 1307]|jgi:uncharacterized protein with ATP-grasp and redox domains
MNLQKDCIDCILKQSKRVSSLLNVSDKQASQIELITQKHINKFDFNVTPTHNAYPLYEDIAKLLGVDDLYKQIKEKSSKKACSFISTCKEKIKNSNDKLFYAIKTAVAGNVIDLAAEVIYDLDDELKKIYETDFAINDFEILKNKLENTKILVYLADNAGEEIFDKICIETIKEIYPNIDVYYFVRGKPIINDLTMAHAKKSGLDEVSTIVDSGVPTPGYAMDLASKSAHEIFQKADCIISKGMGNYECLSEEKNFPIFFLLKVKCQVVAKYIGANLGDIVCKKSY